MRMLEEETLVQFVIHEVHIFHVYSAYGVCRSCKKTVVKRHVKVDGESSS